MESHKQILVGEYDFSDVQVPCTRLVNRNNSTAGPASTEFVFDGLAAALIAGHEGLDSEAPYAMLGGPGTGKTRALIETAVGHLARGGSADEIMVVTPSKESAESFRSAAFERLATQDSLASSGAFVRSIHSWAFALFRSVCVKQDRVAPRLLTGAEHDIQIRELLRGIAGNPDEFRIEWAQELQPALTYVGFARQLRDLLLRANERGLNGADLENLGREYSKPMWTSAGQFLTHFEATRRLSEVGDLNASELLHATVSALQSSEGEGILDQLRDQVKLILIDDAHNLDPAAARLIELLITPQARTIVAGDPDQCVFHFRGADEQFLTRCAQDETRRVVLSLSHRLSTDHVRAVTALQRKLPANKVTRQSLRAFTPSEHSDFVDDSRLLVHTAVNQTTERLLVADHIRRAHVERGIAWNDMAVIVRSTAHIPALRRTLLNHGVPVRIDATSIVLAEQPFVQQLLLILESATRQLTAAELRLLMESAVGGVSPVTMRQIERGIALAVRAEKATGRELPSHDDGTPWRAIDYLCSYLQGDKDLEWITSRFALRERSATERIAELFAEAREAQSAQDRSVEKTLWRVWQKTGLDRVLQSQALRGGTEGSQADQDLDAVMNLFDLAGNFAENSPLGDLGTFIDEVRSQELPTGHRSRVSIEQDSVEILPAHATAGREWSFTVVNGVQEGEWPAGPTVGGLFGQSELVDLLDHGITPDVNVSRIAEAVQEERRLFLLAISRASERTVITAVSQPDADALIPSRFLEELEQSLGHATTQDSDSLEADTDGTGGAEDGGASAAQITVDSLEQTPRVLSRESIVAELRDAVHDHERPTYERQAAARNLAKLAAHGVPEAHPRTWWGTLEPSSDAPVVKIQNGSAMVRLSPSKLDALEKSPFTWFINEHQGVQESTVALRRGSLFHAIAEAYTRGVPLEEGLSLMRVALPLLEDGPEWGSGETIRKWNDALPLLHEWLRDTFGEEATAGQSERITVEKKLTVQAGTLPVSESSGAEDSSIGVILSGRADLIAETDVGSVVYDFKTSATPIAPAEAAEHPQLSAYQYLIHRLENTPPGGAQLVYPLKPARKKPGIRKQSPASPEFLDAFEEKLMQLAEYAIGPEYHFDVDSEQSNPLIEHLINTTIEPVA